MDKLVEEMCFLEFKHLVTKKKKEGENVWMAGFTSIYRNVDFI